MDWVGVGMVAASLAVAAVGIVVVAKAGLRVGKARNKPNRKGKGEGQFQPPEPPEGRYWG